VQLRPYILGPLYCYVLQARPHCPDQQKVVLIVRYGSSEKSFLGLKIGRLTSGVV